MAFKGKSQCRIILNQISHFAGGVDKRRRAFGNKIQTFLGEQGQFSRIVHQEPAGVKAILSERMERIGTGQRLKIALVQSKALHIVTLRSEEHTSELQT